MTTRNPQVLWNILFLEKTLQAVDKFHKKIYYLTLHFVPVNSANVKYISLFSS
jgi:hypothetical protein